MGQDNQPKYRQAARDLARQSARREPIDRILVVCEGEKTEPLYLNEIRIERRLSTANVEITPGQFGTDPLSIVNYAEHLFSNGDSHKKIKPREFDCVYAVFDRDDHQSYYAALNRVQQLNGTLLNTDDAPVLFQAIASVPCFEIWPLLHFQNVQAPIHRDEVYRRLRIELPGYEKGQGGHWDRTKLRLNEAIGHAIQRAAATTAWDGHETFTDMHTLVQKLLTLRN